MCAHDQNHISAAWARKPSAPRRLATSARHTVALGDLLVVELQGLESAEVVVDLLFADAFSWINLELFSLESHVPRNLSLPELAASLRLLATC